MDELEDMLKQLVLKIDSKEDDMEEKEMCDCECCKKNKCISCKM